MDLTSLPFDKQLWIFELFTSNMVRVHCEDVRYRQRKRRQHTYDDLRQMMLEKRRVMLQLGRYEELADVDLGLKMLDEYQAVLDRTGRHETAAEKRARLLTEERYEELARLQRKKRGLNRPGR